MSRDRSLPVEETLAFVRSTMGPARRVLEVGTGGGALARRLMDEGIEVVGLDAREEAVREARTRGVDARHAEWPAFEEDGYEAILFTRSLHHIRPLEAALDRAEEVLAPGGRIVVEDFAFAKDATSAASWKPSARESPSRLDFRGRTALSWVSEGP